MWYLKNLLILVGILIVVMCLWAFIVGKEGRKQIPRLGAFWIGLGAVTWTILYFTGFASSL